MSKLMSFVLLALLCPIAPAALACGEPLPPVAKPMPAENADYVKKTVLVELQGKLMVMRCLVEGNTNMGIQAGGKIVWIDLRGNKTWHRIVAEAGNKPIVAKGELIGKVVRVTDLAAAGDSSSFYKETVKVEIRGDLSLDQRDILRSNGAIWVMTIGDEEYLLTARGNKKLAERVSKLVGRRVIVVGTLTKEGTLNIVDVERLEADDAREFTISFSRTSGVPDFAPTKEVTFDSMKLTGQRADELRKLIEAAKFLELKSSNDPPKNLPDPPAGYKFALTIGEKLHRIWVTDSDLTPAMTALVGRMKALAVEQFAQTLVGMTYEAAKAKAIEEGCLLRVAAEDGKANFLTDDLRRNRINVVIEKGKIVSVSVG